MNNNMPLSVDTGRGFSINYLGKNLYSKYDPSKNPEKIVDSIELEEETLYILPSPLLLYGLDSLLERLPESSFVLAIEIDQKLMAITRAQKKLDSNAKCEVVRLDSREQLKFVIEKLGTWRFRRCRLIPVNYGYNIYKSKYDFLFNFASHLLSTFWRNRLTLNKLGKNWIKNIFVNVENISDLGPDNHGKPIIICGAGPSFEKSIPLIKANRHNLYIIAVDTALSALIQSDIKPDLIFALESQFYNLGDFYNSIDMDIDILTDITGYPPVCRKLKGNTYFFASEFLQNRLLERVINNYNLKLTIPPLGSVGVAAVYTARKLFNTDIFLTGLDFSFIPGKSHCNGSPFNNFQLRTSSRIKPAGSYNIAMNRKLIIKEGKLPNTTIKTDSVLDSYAKLLIDIISCDDKIYDLTSTGYPLGAKRINENEFNSLIQNPYEKKQKEKIPANRIPEPNHFILNELKLLRNLINLWDNFNRDNLEEIPEEIMTALEMVDYIYVDFPDRLPHPRKEISFLNRAVISGRSYIEFLENLIK